MSTRMKRLVCNVDGHLFAFFANVGFGELCDVNALARNGDRSCDI